MLVKALHIKIDCYNEAIKSNLEQFYSSKAVVFPLGIAMQLVIEYKQLMNLQVTAKAKCLCAHQECFHAQMQTSTTWEITTQGPHGQVNGSNTLAI